MSEEMNYSANPGKHLVRTVEIGRASWRERVCMFV